MFNSRNRKVAEEERLRCATMVAIAALKGAEVVEVGGAEERQP